MAEHEGAVPFGSCLAKQLDEGVELCRGRFAFVDQVGRERELAKQGERAEDLEPVRVDVVDQTEHFLALTCEPAVVEPPVGRVQIEHELLLLLGRQFRCDKLFGAAQQEGADAALQRPQPFVVAFSFDGCAVVLGEAAAPSQQTRARERDERPQLEQVVLERSAGDDEREGGVQHPGAFVALRRRVLDLLSLVENEPLPVQGRVSVELETEQRVAGHDDVRPGDLVGQCRAALVSHCADRSDAQLGRESRALGSPVADDAGGGDDEKRRMLLVARLKRIESCFLDHRDGLQGLTQAHVVGEHPAELVSAQEVQPGVPCALVVAQLGAQRRWRINGGELIVVAEPTHPHPPFDLLARDDAQLDELFPEVGLVATDLHRGDGAVREGTGFGDDLAQALQLGRIEREVGAARQDEDRLVLAECPEQGSEVDVLTLDAHLHAQVEPVVGSGLGGDRDIRRLGCGTEAGGLDVFDDPHGLERAQAGQHFGDEKHSSRAAQGLVGRHHRSIRPLPRQDDGGVSTCSAANGIEDAGLAIPVGTDAAAEPVPSPGEVGKPVAVVDAHFEHGARRCRHRVAGIGRYDRRDRLQPWQIVALEALPARRVDRDGLVGGDQVAHRPGERRIEGVQHDAFFRGAGCGDPTHGDRRITDGHERLRRFTSPVGTGVPAGIGILVVSHRHQLAAHRESLAVLGDRDPRGQRLPVEPHRMLRLARRDERDPRRLEIGQQRPERPRGQPVELHPFIVAIGVAPRVRGRVENVEFDQQRERRGIRLQPVEVPPAGLALDPCASRTAHPGPGREPRLLRSPAPARRARCLQGDEQAQFHGGCIGCRQQPIERALPRWSAVSRRE